MPTKTGPITKAEIAKAARAEGRAQAKGYHATHGRRLNRLAPWSATWPSWDTAEIVESDAQREFGRLALDDGDDRWMSVYVAAYVKAAFAWRP